MRAYLALLFILSSLYGFSQKAFNVLDWKTDVTLNSYLVQQMHQQYDTRRHNFAKALSTPGGLKTYQLAVRQKFRQLLGDFPQRGALNAISTGKIDREEYTIEKIVYESFPGHHVTANLYIPQRQGRLPAALLFCGHEDASKATESYQRTAILLARNGFVVLAVDPISQSERYQLTDAGGKPLTRGGTTEHTLLNESSNLLGTSAPAYELWDNTRSMDYLVSRKEVDTTRIGCIGNSGGAMQSIYFAAYDSRVKLIVPCSYLSSRERTLELTGPADGCAQIPGEGKAGLEFSDYLIAAAPKPVLVLAGRYDFIDYKGVEIAYEELKRVYSVLGQPQKVQLFTYDDGHGISQPKREAAVTWFRKWFYNDPTPVKEGPFPVLTDKELMVTNSGQVATEYPREISLVKRNLQLYDSLASTRQQFISRDRNRVLDTIRSLLAFKANNHTLQVQSAGITTKDSIVYHKLILRKQGEVPLPVLVVFPDTAKRIIIWLYDKGKNKLADSLALIHSYKQKGYAIILADLRGLGETEDRAEFNDPKYYNKEYRNAMLAVHIAQPLVGQRVTDVLTLLEFSGKDQRLAGLPVEMHASGRTAISALHAMAINSKISTLNLYDCIRSYKEVLENPAGKDWYSYIVPNILRYYDLPDLVQFIGPGKIIFHQQGNY